MEDQMCPRCKTTKYRNPALKLMVNVCGHTLCENCVDLLFVRGSGACIECGTALRRNNFRLQLFEDAGVEKEVDIRKKILRDFNKKEDDFGTLKEYNDYLEEIETTIFNLVNGVDVDDTKKKIEQYKKENWEQIKKSKSKMSKDEEYLEYLIDVEKQTSEVRKHQLIEEETKQKNVKKQRKQAIIDDLMFSDLPADLILAQHKVKEETEPEITSIPRQAFTKFSTGVKLGHRNEEFSFLKQDFGNVYKHTDLALETCGPEVPTCEKLEKEGYLSHIRGSSEADLAGGFESKMACHRALQEALCGLFYHFETSNPLSVPSSTSSSDVADVEMS
ncbi:CDK-activating kinase assembly factor MAT1-like [Lineus longissimus]|uniref:CDK-activating kinase assembly factor MAT1-like n=1 Tax=Lineus longissimus TaxID=88925 RepID=UPI002B4EA51A